MAFDEYADDATIPDEAELWRRIPPWWFHHDAALDRPRPAKAAFDDDRDGNPMSVVIAAESRGPQTVLAGHVGFALVSFTAALARQCNLRVVRAPTTDEPAHALVVGRKTDSIKRRLDLGSSTGRRLTRALRGTSPLSPSAQPRPGPHPGPRDAGAIPE
jgi:hypothetical protein